MQSFVSLDYKNVLDVLDVLVIGFCVMLLLGRKDSLGEFGVSDLTNVKLNVRIWIWKKKTHLNF
jgi:hypothetical protein